MKLSRESLEALPPANDTSNVLSIEIALFGRELAQNGGWRHALLRLERESADRLAVLSAENAANCRKLMESEREIFRGVRADFDQCLRHFWR